MFEHRLGYLDNTFLLTPRVILGLQPKDQSFFTKKGEFLGYAGCRIDWISKKVHPWVEIAAKTDGWVAGNEFLNKNFSFRAGRNIP